MPETSQVYDGTWFDAPNGDWAHALCNNNQADCADDIYLAPYMTGCPEGYDFPATEGACQRAADLSSGYEYGGAEGPTAGPTTSPTITRPASGMEMRKNFADAARAGLLPPG